RWLPRASGRGRTPRAGSRRGTRPHGARRTRPPFRSSGGRPRTTPSWGIPRCDLEPGKRAAEVELVEPEADHVGGRERFEEQVALGPGDEVRDARVLRREQAEHLLPRDRGLEGPGKVGRKVVTGDAGLRAGARELQDLGGQDRVVPRDALLPALAVLVAAPLRFERLVLADELGGPLRGLRVLDAEDDLLGDLGENLQGLL